MGATATVADDVTNPAQTRWLGIDFSGDNKKWSARCSKSNVWIAEITPGDDLVRLASLKRVQELQGDDSPFARLADAIDAVLCAFAAKAVSQGELATQGETFDDEGQIAVHA